MNDERWSTIISEMKAGVPVDIEPTGEGRVLVVIPNALYSLTQKQARELLQELEDLNFERYGPPTAGTREAAGPAARVARASRSWAMWRRPATRVKRSRQLGEVEAILGGVVDGLPRRRRTGALSRWLVADHVAAAGGTRLTPMG
jgi:hypothetical protein